MTEPGAYVLAPAAEGWRFEAPGGGWSEPFPTLEEAARALPPGASRVRLALPARLALLERFTLPSTDAAELDGMVRLQLEKTLPYPVEETVFAFLAIAEKPPETEGVACVVHRPALETLAAPLVEAGLFPERVTLQAMHVAAQAPRQGAACGVWREEGQTVVGLFENGILSFLETLPGGEDAAREVSQALLSAELAGAPGRRQLLLLDPALASHSGALSEAVGAPVQTLRPAPAPDAETADLTPEAWRLARSRARRKEALKRKARLALLGYAALLFLAFGFLGLQRLRIRALDRELAKLRPQADAALARQSRWQALEPAVQRGRFTVEVLYQVFDSLPSKEIRITQFEASPTQLKIQGEAPGAAEAIAFAEALKKREELSGYEFEARQPTLLPNDHAQFSIFAKR